MSSTDAEHTMWGHIEAPAPWATAGGMTHGGVISMSTEQRSVVHRRPPEERFWEKVDKNGPGGCWLWTASKISAGYGNFVPNGRGSHTLAHRWAYEQAMGPIPAGADLDHLCRTPACVNPDHLEAVTHRENVLRGTSPSAGHARKTHCSHGHELVPENIYTPPSLPNARCCRTCRAAAAERSNERRKADGRRRRS